MSYIVGRVIFYLAYFKPIEDASFDGQNKASLASIIGLTNKLAHMQNRIYTGDIQLENAEEAFWRDKPQYEKNI